MGTSSLICSTSPLAPIHMLSGNVGPSSWASYVMARAALVALVVFEVKGPEDSYGGLALGPPVEAEQPIYLHQACVIVNRRRNGTRGQRARHLLRRLAPGWPRSVRPKRVLDRWLPSGQHQYEGDSTLLARRGGGEPSQGSVVPQWEGRIPTGRALRQVRCVARRECGSRGADGSCPLEPEFQAPTPRHRRWVARHARMPASSWNNRP
jgi:hypothetical protein